MYVIEVDDVAGDKHRRFCENIKRRTQHSLMGLTVEIAAGSSQDLVSPRTRLLIQYRWLRGLTLTLPGGGRVTLRNRLTMRGALCLWLVPLRSEIMVGYSVGVQSSSYLVSKRGIGVPARMTSILLTK